MSGCNRIIIKTVTGVEPGWDTDGRECTHGCCISRLCETGELAILRTMKLNGYYWELLTRKG